MSDTVPSTPRPTVNIAETNRALAERFFREVWNERRSSTIDEILHEGIVGHLEGADFTGTATYKEARAQLLSAFPDVRVTVEDTVADGEHVVLRWRVTGTHSGPGLGLSPTSRTVSFRGMTWLTFREGRVVEGWDSWNQGALLQSLATA